MESDSTELRWVWLAAGLAAAVPILTVATALLERSGPIRLRSWLEDVGGSLAALSGKPAEFEALRYLVNVLAKFSALALFATLLASTAKVASFFSVWSAVVLVGLWVASSELLARHLLVSRGEWALQVWTPAFRSLFWILRPLVSVLSTWAPRAQHREEDLPANESEVSEEVVEAYLDVGTREGILEPEERELVWGVVDFGDTPVRAVMTPRVDIVACPSTASLEELADRFVQSAHTRIPVYRETIDQVVGVVHVRDLLVGLRSVPQPTLDALAQPPVLVPETRLLKDVLRDLRTRRQQLAIVINEWGGTEGLVTIQDLIERIVGEIPDEHGNAPVSEQTLADGSVLLDGRTELEALRDRFDFVPGEVEHTITTLGGWIVHRLGRVPERGELIEESGFRLEIVAADGRRILSVRLTPPPKSNGAQSNT